MTEEKQKQQESEQPKPKKWWNSKTIRFSGAVGSLGLAILALPEFKALIDTLPPEYVGGAALVIAIVQVGLRAITSEPIGK